MKQRREYSLYMHTNMINNKKYIGITKLKPEQRWKSGLGYKTQVFYNAIKKYGWNNFQHKVLFTNLTKEEAEMFEIYAIKYHKSDNSKYGYNIAKGGRIKGCCAESTRKKLRKIRKGQKVSTETRNKISKHHADVSGVNNPMFGKTGELSLSYGTGKPIICLETKEIFNSIRIAGDKMNIKAHNISYVLHKRMNSTKGFHFMFLEEYDPNVEYNLKSGRFKQPIICLNNNKIFNSIKECAIEMNLDESAITKVCKKKFKQTKGYVFEYLNKNDK